MHILFANTGVQVVCVPLQSGRRYTTAQIGYGWQHCRCKPEAGAEEEHDEDEAPQPILYPYIQWQIIQSNVSKIFFAVDTSLGDPELGYFSDPSTLAGDFHVKLQDILDRAGQPLQGIPDVELCLRAASATAGEAKPVHMVVDFGNSRTGALLIEMAGEVSQTAEMTPFELMNRYNLDHFNDEGEQISKPNARWFSSKTRWANTPFLDPPEMAKKEYYRETRKGLFGKKQVARERETYVRPNLFDDWSMSRMGREVDDICQIMHAKGDFRTGISSPKRYLWAEDDSWLEGAFWYMADPHDRDNTGEFAAKLHGPLLRYIHEDDRDFLIEKEDPPEELFAQTVPTKPVHPPRCLMTTAVYEMLCQAYAQINSIGYRSRTDDPARAREIHSLTMTFPSGMFQPEKERFVKQCLKAINIFNRTLGKHQRVKPQLTFSIDEASAVHLTYIWAELRMLGQDPRLWFAALSRDHSGSKGATPPAEGTEGEAGTAVGVAPAGRRRGSPARPSRPSRPGKPGAAGAAPEIEDDNKRRELRIACIDIGGGTTDLMIASYVYQPGIDDSIQGKVLHQDGVAIAGDQLVKRMLERIIVPKYASAIGLEEEDVQLLFGPRVPKNRGFTSQRIDWVNRMFVPLAEAYLQAAVDEVAQNEPDREQFAISHTDPELVDPAVLESLEQVCTKLRGPGYYDLSQDLGLTFEKSVFEDVVHEVFDDLLFDFCTRIAEYQADVVLLAGQPSKLGYIQDLVRKYLPLPASRVIPMFNHFAGNWYPYQDPKGNKPGLIVDPKSAVVVGAAIEFMARNGMLSQFKFAMRGKDKENTYYWGVMTESTATIREERVLFFPVEDENTKDEWTEFTTIALRTLLGRKMSGDEASQATPIYVLKMETFDRIGQTEVTVRIRRVPADDETEEHLELDSVTGTVAGQPAVLDENVFFIWRTLADESYFLDTGGLDNIEIGK
jgi:hypothetical protein